MELCKFTAPLLDQGGDAAMELWKGEMPVPQGMERTLYHFLVRYYYIPESEYNFAMLDEGRLRGFLLAAPATMPESHKTAREWILPRLTDEAQKSFLFHDNVIWISVFSIKQSGILKEIGYIIRQNGKG